MKDTEQAKKNGHHAMYHLGMEIRAFHDRFHNIMFCADDVRKKLNLSASDIKKYTHEMYLDGEKLVGIAEADLYKLMLLSDRKIVRPFQHWIFNIVIPEIRKTGEYRHFLNRKDQEG